MTRVDVRVVHEGRGGYVEVGGRRYAIEHVGGGRFCIHLVGKGREQDRVALEQLLREEPAKWVLEVK